MSESFIICDGAPCAGECAKSVHCCGHNNSSLYAWSVGMYVISILRLFFLGTGRAYDLGNFSGNAGPSLVFGSIGV